MEKELLDKLWFAENDVDIKDESPTFRVYWDDEIITESKIINYYKIFIRELIDENKLLGRFDDFGSYKIDIEIKKDLARMDKEITEITNETIYAKANYFKKEFSFVIDIISLEDEMSRAELYLIEEVKAQHCQTFKTFVASLTDKKDGFISRVKKVFHLVDGTPVLHDDQIPNIAILLQGQVDNGIFLDELIELGSQIFVLRMPEELEKCGEIGKQIVEEFKIKMKEKENVLETPKEKQKPFEYKHVVNKKFTKMRQMLDEIVEKNGGYQNLPLKGDIKSKLFDDFNHPVEKVEELRKTYRNVENKSGPVVATPKNIEKSTNNKEVSTPNKNGTKAKKKNESNSEVVKAKEKKNGNVDSKKEKKKELFDPINPTSQTRQESIYNEHQNIGESENSNNQENQSPNETVTVNNTDNEKTQDSEDALIRNVLIGVLDLAGSRGPGITSVNEENRREIVNRAVVKKNTEVVNNAVVTNEGQLEEDIQ